MSRSSVLSPHMWSLLLLSSAVNQISPTRVDFWNSPLGHLRFWYLNPSLEMWKLLPNIICARYWDPLDIQHRLGPCMCLILIANCCTNRGWNTGTTLSFTCRERRTIVLGQWATCNVQCAMQEPTVGSSKQNKNVIPKQQLLTHGSLTRLRSVPNSSLDTDLDSSPSRSALY